MKLIHDYLDVISALIIGIVISLTGLLFFLVVVAGPSSRAEDIPGAIFFFLLVVVLGIVALLFWKP